MGIPASKVQLKSTNLSIALSNMAPTSLRLLRFSQAPARRLILAQSRPTLLPRTAIQFSRPASTAAADASSLVTRLKNLLYGTSLSLFAVFSYLYITDTRASVHQWLVVPTLRWVYPDAEDAHHAGTKALKALYSFNLHPRERPSKKDAADLSVVVYGQKLQNPIGNTTNRRDNILPKDLPLTANEKAILSEKGGLSGPHMFERTLGLVKRYRQLLDQGPPPEPKPEEKTPAKPVGGISTGDEPGSNIAEKLESTKEVVSSAVSAAVSGVKDTISGKPHEQEVIFATGGITNGKQALEILNAGASVAQVYTALTYGGSGTITRIKREMKEEIERR